MDALSPEAVRVLGALVEKDLSTPEYYPLTVNALTVACNQKSNRDPVVAYSDETVQAALDALQRRRLVGVVSGAHLRAPKYRHTLAETFGLPEPALAVLAELMLRGPQTAGELRARTARMATFGSVDEVETVLAALATAGATPLVAALPLRPGRKEARFAHLLGGPVEETAEPATGAVPPDPLPALEAEVEALRARLDTLEAEFQAFRDQFG